MTPVEGDAVATVVFTPTTLLRSCGGVELIRMCQCQYGRCQHCGHGMHDKCAHAGQADRPGRPHTHVVGRSGSALAQVWHTGRACRWLCSCPCRTTVQAVLF